MDARDLLRSGDALSAIAQLKAEVRSAPRDACLRTFLFQMFCVTGEWERALAQLAMAAELDGTAIPMAQTYQAAIRCELLRERIFAGARTPTLFGEPSPWMSLLVEALRQLAAGAFDAAARLRDEAFEQAPAASGTADGRDFGWIADADPRLGPMLEAIIDGKYYWIPFFRLKSLSLDPPEDVRDQVWMPAHFTFETGGETAGLIPTRYPGSPSAGIELAMARRTEWREEHGWFLGLGQRMLALDDGSDVALMDLRSLQMA